MKSPAKRSKKNVDSAASSIETVGGTPSKRNDRKKTAVVRAEYRQQVWQGPVPPPAVIKEYDEVIKDGAGRLFRQFESESGHRREMEILVAKLKGRDLLTGKILALIFALGVLAVVAFAVQKGSPWVAAILGGGMLATVVFGFLRVFGDEPRLLAPRRSEPKDKDRSD